MASNIINYLSINENFSAYEDGVYSLAGENNVIVTLPIYDMHNTLINYTRDMLKTEINSQLSANPISNGSYLYLTQPDSNYNYKLRIRMNINRIYRAKDYKVVFYDTVSFVKCFAGATGVQNTTWDSTLGWILGFHNSTTYDLSAARIDNNIAIIDSDTAVTTNLYNYFLICLNDFNLNHLDDGLVTITGKDTTSSLPSYADRSQFQCDPITNRKTYNPNAVNANDKQSQITQNQLNSIVQKNNAAITTTSNLLGGQSSTSYGRGPFSQDVFAMIPMKVAGLQNGQYFVEYGGTLQNNNRYYFGPVNIHRMSIKLITDKGNTVDLNGTNWSFSFICQQLYKNNKK
jgi:ABC-type antimicrobial peptide transport system permease subunit